MPDLQTSLHLDMYSDGRRRRSFGTRLRQAVSLLLGRQDVYGLEWGDPEVLPPLRYVRDHFLLPYITNESTVVEIGPGGGRWTRYMTDAKKIYAVDYHKEILDELRRNVSWDSISFINNDGADFPGIPEGSVDFLFSFGVFVHLDIDIIDAYLENMKPLLKAESNVVLQYADQTKPLAQRNPGFSKNDPERMRELVRSHGYIIREEDEKTMWHSAIMRFGLTG